MVGCRSSKVGEMTDKIQIVPEADIEDRKKGGEV